MNILIATKSKFLNPAKVMLYSLFNEHPDTDIDVWLMYHDLTSAEVTELKNYVALFTYKRLHAVDVGEEFSRRVKAFGNFSIEIFYRILAIELLPKDMDRILYLDADIIVQKNLEGLYNTDIEGYPFAVCEDISSKLNGTDKEIKDRIGLSQEQPYFNSGVMLFNLKFLRETHAEDAILEEVYDKYDKYPYPDQDVMNKLYVGRLKYLGWDMYNCHPGAYFLDMEAEKRGELCFAQYGELMKHVHNDQFTDVTEALCRNAAIVHYVGASKPWNPGYDEEAKFYRSFADVYRRYEHRANMKNTVLVIKGESRYEVLRRAAEQTAEAFKKAGMNTVVVDSTQTDFSPGILFENEYAFVLMPQAFLFDMRFKDGSCLIEKIKSPIVGWIFDDVLYHFERVQANVYPHVVLMSVDGSADRIVHDMGLNTNPMFGMLHGGFEADDTEQNRQRTKDIDIFCPGSIGEEPVIPDEFDDTKRTLALEAEILFEECPELSARQLLAQVCDKHGMEFVGESMYRLSDVLLYIMSKMRFVCRKRIVEEALKSGCKVAFAGVMPQGEKADGYGENAEFLGPMDIDDTVRMIARSKVLLNPFPTIYEEGAHERIYTAMLNRAVLFTPGSEFLRGQLNDRVEYIDLKNVDGLGERIATVVNGFEQYRQKLEDNYMYAKANHTWEHRGEEILHLLLD